MYKDKLLAEVMDILSARKCYLYHACQLKDFKTYLELNGIPSRGEMQSKAKEFTSFETDDEDQKNGVWNFVFGNFSDFSSSFHRGGRSIPNPYGPILIKLDPKFLLDADDFSVALRSAGAKGFNRNSESLETIEDLHKLFVKAQGEYGADWIKKKSDLVGDFPERNVTSSPEWSASFTNGLLSIDHFVNITVDPITIRSINLLDEVKRLSTGYHHHLGAIVSRTTVDKKLSPLVACVDAQKTLDQVAEEEALKKWVSDIKDLKLGYQYRRYQKYLKDGTLDQMGVIDKPRSA